MEPQCDFPLHYERDVKGIPITSNECNRGQHHSQWRNIDNPLLSIKLSSGNVCNWWYRCMSWTWHHDRQAAQKMLTTRYSEAFWEASSKCRRVYEESRLSGLFIDGLHHSICSLLRTYWGTNKGVSLQNMARYTTSFFKRQISSNTSIIASHVEDGCRQTPSKNKIPQRCRSAIMAIANKFNTRHSSSSRKAPSKALSRSKSRFHTSKMRMTPQENEAFITSHIEAPLQSACRYPASSCIAAVVKMRVTRRAPVL